MPRMSEPTRWSADQVLAVAPDQASLASARKLASSADWSSVGVSAQEPVLWGLCRGSGKNPYQTCVDLTEPAYRCSCPSRKFPCKHALALLLKWSAGAVPVGEPEVWVAEWQESRSARAAKKAEKISAPRTEAQERAAQRRAQSREEKVMAGVAELQQWLSDQVRHGIAGLESSGYRHFEPVAARLIDAQAPGLAGAVRRLATIPSSGAGWEERTLAEMAMLHMLAGAADRLDTLPPDLAATVRSRLGHQVTTEQVLAGTPVRDVWQVIGARDLTEDRLVARRVYLIGRDTGQEALVLSFAAPGQVLSADLVVGTCVEADLCFYPGSLSLRALVSARHGAPELMSEPQRSTSVAAGSRSARRGARSGSVAHVDAVAARRGDHAGGAMASCRSGRRRAAPGPGRRVLAFRRRGRRRHGEDRGRVGSGRARAADHVSRRGGARGMTEALWPQLLSSALVGTDRRACRPSSVPGPLATVLGEGPAELEPPGLLAAAAAVTVARRAGAMPTRVPLPDPAPEETAQVAPEKASVRLGLLLLDAGSDRSPAPSPAAGVAGACPAARFPSRAKASERACRCRHGRSHAPAGRHRRRRAAPGVAGGARPGPVGVDRAARRVCSRHR